MSHDAIKDQLRESQLFLGRAVTIGILVIGLMALLAGRLFFLQVTQHDHYRTQSRDNRVKLVPLPPTRGLVYDREGRLLAQNLPAYSLEIIPEQVRDMDATLRGLADIVRVSEEDLQRFEHLRRQRRRFDSIPLRVRLEEDEVARFAVHRHRFPGADIRASLSRHYPLGDYTAHVLGYVGRISEADLEQIEVSEYAGTSHIGKIGVEKSYEAALHGSVGMQQVEVNALGRVIRVLESQPPVPGRDLHLHLDIGLQRVAMEAFGDYRGAAVAMDPETGGVLALVSAPAYDPNQFVDGISRSAYAALRDSLDKPLYNRALRGQYPPGSTVKPFIGLGGLELGTVSPDHANFCPGFYRLPGHSHRYRDWRKGGHGWMDVDEAITQSCDVYFYDLAHDMGVDRLHAYLAEFGFGARSGVDLVGERPGLLPSRDWKKRARREPWYPGETLIMGIGQGYFLATPLQLAAATAALANNGRFVAPRVASKISSAQGETSALPTEERLLHIERPDNWAHILKAMTHVVEGERGTAKRIRDDRYRIAGKTGTAQVFTVAQDEEYDEEEVEERKRDHALFIAFAPLEVPRIAVAVIVENGGHGSSVAAPIAKQIMDAYLLGDSADREG